MTIFAQPARAQAKIHRIVAVDASAKVKRLVRISILTAGTPAARTVWDTAAVEAVRSAAGLGNEVPGRRATPHTKDTSYPQKKTRLHELSRLFNVWVIAIRLCVPGLFPLVLPVPPLLTCVSPLQPS
jgi:hypothetical protein